MEKTVRQLGEFDAKGLGGAAPGAVAAAIAWETVGWGNPKPQKPQNPMDAPACLTRNMVSSIAHSRR
jgi:hypothetical protein